MMQPARASVGLVALLAVVAGAHAKRVDDVEVLDRQRAAMEMLGHATTALILQSETILVAPDTQLMLERLANRLAAESGMQRRFRVHLINSPMVNMMVVPSGDIFVYAGFLERVDNVHEIAFGIAHELVHVERDHSLKKLSKLARTQRKGQIIGSIVIGAVSTAAYTAAGFRLRGLATGTYGEVRDRLVVRPMSAMVARAAARVPEALLMHAMASTLSAYSQAQEIEADERALRIVLAAGYDPKAAIRVMSKLSDSWHAE